MSALGDVVCSLPAAVALREAYPEAEIHWMVDRRFRGIVDCCTAVNHTVELPKKLADLKTKMAELGEFDLALDLQGLLKSALPVYLSRAKSKFGYHWQREGAALLVPRVQPNPHSIHVVDQYLDVAVAAGGTVRQKGFGLQPKIEDIEIVRDKLHQAGLAQDQAFLLMNAGAGWATKRWNPAYFAQVAQAVQAQGYQVAFLGTEADRPAYEEVIAHGLHALDLLGKTNVRQLVALTSLARLHLGGDTGSTHLAAALGIPAIGVYTLTKPDRSCPYGQREHCRSLDPVEVTTLALELLEKSHAK
jgi:ADP-heptose:LPS heptosyltransferase